MAEQTKKPPRKNQRKLTASRATKEAFLRVIEPELLSWGLRPHPSPSSYYGGADSGYHWDFADITDPSNVRLISFSIINPRQNLVIQGLKDIEWTGDASALPQVWGNSKGVFRLTSRWSICRPMDVSFRFNQRRNQTLEEAAEALMLSVLHRLPLMREFLYQTRG